MLSTSAIVKRKVLFERVASIFETWFVIRFWGGELTVLSFAYSLSFLLFFFPLQRRRAQSASKIVEKLKRRLAEQEAALLLAIPSLPVTLYHKQGKVSCICL